MKRFIGILVLFFLMGCSSASAPTTEKMETSETANDDIKVSVGEVSFVAMIENSETGKAFLSKLPLTLDMNELHGNEKYH